MSLPVILILCLAVAIESRGAPIFKQTRLGKKEKPFSLYKIRTMYTGTGDHPTHNVSGENITRVGRFIRRVKIDELPQLWNVICGEMSLVGPRPGLPKQKTLAAIRRQNGIFEYAPGITGLAQVNGIDMSTHDELAFADRDYIARRSISLDMQILIATFVRSKAPKISSEKNDG
ncbi:UNVERIFIED_CONTAM: hypothetical protein GTU68_041433 [Idotea baltica]|nr:hypothetical protein [Idotea baltica]